MEKKPKTKAPIKKEQAEKKRKIRWNFAKGKSKVLDASFIEEDEKL